MNDRVTRIFKGVRAGADLPAIPLGRQLRATPMVPEPVKPLVDLNGRPKVLLVIAPGGVGKTTWLRWCSEIALTRDPDSSAIFAAVGDRRDLAGYLPVAQPDSYDPVQETRWLEALIDHCMENKVSAAIDFDGGDTTVASLVAQQDDLAALVEAAGVSLVAIYLLSPRLTDLTTMATLEQSGFTPKATAIILNSGVGDGTVPFEVAFAATQRHEAFRAAVERGAVVIRMPRLIAAASAIEQRRISFVQARDATTEQPLAGFERGYVATWLVQMQQAMAPLLQAGWLP